MAIGTTAAVIGSAVIGAGATMAAAGQASDASAAASNAQVQATRDQIAAAERQYERTLELFQGYLRDADQADAWLRALYEGSATYVPAGSNSGAPVTITRADVEAAINGTPMAQAARDFLDARNAITDETFTGQSDLAEQEYADLMAVGDQNYADLTELADRARTGRLSVAESNLLQRLALEEDSYAAWELLSQDAEQKAINLDFSRMGVTGQVGATRRGVGETTQAAAMDRNLRRLEGQQAAYAPYYADVSNAEEAYWGDMGEATGSRAEWRGATTATRSGRRLNAYNARQAGREANYDTYTDDYAANYNDFLANNLGRRSSRGQDARGVISGAGQTMTNTIVDAYGRRGEAQANDAVRQGQIQQQTYADLANIIGNAAGTWSRRRTGSTNNPGG